MPSQVKTLICFAMVSLAFTLSLRANCQDRNRPPYLVDNLPLLEKPYDASFADDLSERIRKVLPVGGIPSYKNFWEECCNPNPKPKYCAVIVIKMDTLADESKRLSIEIREQWPDRAWGHLTTALSCSPTQTVKACYRSLLGRMADAVKEYDVQCHSGKKCHVENGVFVSD